MNLDQHGNVVTSNSRQGLPSRPMVSSFKPTVREKTFGALTSSVLTSPVIDGAAGAAVGWVVAPSDAKLGYALGGAIATGLFGWLGLVGTLGWRYLADKRK